MRLLLLASLFAALVFAQVDTGTLSGTVTDSSGAVVPQAKVVIRNEGTGQGLEITTNDDGYYVSPPLRPGEYSVQIEATGFRKVQKKLPLDVNQRASVDFQLDIGSVTEEVVVQAVAPVLQTESATVSSLRTEQSIKDLPLNGRNFAQLIQLSAGTAPTQTQVGGLQIVQKRGIPNVSVNGARHEENNFLVEGLNNNENHNGNGILMYPSVDAIQEFRVESSVADAQFGRGGGGTINLTYKSGTREFHGGLYHFLRNEKLDAKNFFDKAEDPIPPFKQNQFGAFLGGPLFPWRTDHRTFFFTDYEGLKVRQAQTFQATVPTLAYRAGDFSGSAQEIFDPLTQRRLQDGTFVRDPFPGNRIPAERIDPIGRNILSLYPEPNLPGEANNFLYNPVKVSDGYKFDVKVDHIISEKDTGFVRYSRSGDDLLEPGQLPAPGVGGGPGVPGTASQPLNQIVASETHLFSADKINEFRAGWTRLNLRQFNLNYGEYVTEGIGVPGGNVPGDILTSGLSIFSINGQTNLGDNGFSPAVVVSDNIQFSDAFSYIRGGHTFKVGGEVQRRRYNAFQSNALRGTMAFNGAYTQNPASRVGTGFGPADVLLGKPTSADIRFLNGTRGFRRTEYSLFAQDTWKVSQAFTLTLGLRYEKYSGWPWTEVNDRMHQFIPDGGGTVVQVGSDRVPWRSGAPGDNNNLGPRVGLAYKVTPTTVFRAGYGFFYSTPNWDVTRNLGANPPEFVVSGFTNDQFNFIGARPASQGFDRPAQGTITGSLRALDPTVRTPYTQQWNASLQQQFPGQISLTAGYVGSKGTKLQGFPDQNQPVVGDGPVNSRRPFPLYQTIQTIQTRFNSNYNSLQVTGEKRFSQGLGFQLTYTWAHTIDDIGAQFGDVMDYNNIALDRGNSNYDIRHRFVASWTYELPFRTSGVSNLFIGGWQLNGILSLYTGFPFSVASSVNTLNIGSGTRADRLGLGQLPRDQQTIERWFDTSAFTAPGFRQFGNGGRNILTGPGTRQLDLSLFKEFPLGENPARRLEFRTEFFNFTNTPQFNDPNSTFGNPAFGRITSAGSPQSLQRTPRQIQFGLKLYF
ncbi:MAG: TonB-dependent receptor domain-containing protein [Bryobacteraceae bacterium]